MSERVSAVALTYGQASGEILKLAEPISFWGGVDSQTGVISDRHHPDFGKSVVGKIMVLEASRGSSSGSYVLMELMRADLAPSAIVVAEPDGVICTGVLAGEVTYQINLPVIQIDLTALKALESGQIGQVVSEPDSQSYLLISLT